MSRKIYDTEKILRGPFDLETHKEAFVNYLEVVIRADGTVEYAVPSHQEKLIGIAMEQLGVTRKQLYDMCPREYMFDVCAWLCKITGCVSVWNDYRVGVPNETQVWVLRNLKHHGLYRGEILALRMIKNPDTEAYETATAAVKANDGYCPCLIYKTPDTKCPCKDFREQEVEGECHCGRYVKIAE